MLTKPIIHIILTEVQWKKKKGVFAKIGGKTGISEAMRAVKLAHDKVKWDKIATKIVLVQAGENLTPALLDEIDKAYYGARGGLLTLYKAVVVLETTLGKTLEKYKKNPLIPSASLKQVTDMLKQAKITRLAWSPAVSDAAWKKFVAARRAEMDENLEQIRDLLDNLDEVEAYLNRVQARPTVATYNAGRGAVLSLTAEIVKVIEDLSARAGQPGHGVKPHVGRFPGIRGLGLLRQNLAPEAPAAEVLNVISQARSSVGSVREFARAAN